MKKAWNRCAALVLALLLCVSMLSVYAAAAETVTVKDLEVILHITGDLSSSAEREYTFRLTPVTPGAPLPEKVETTEDGTRYTDLVIQATGTGEFKGTFAPFTFSQVGEYDYTLTQIPGDYSRCNYDTTVYDVKITVYNKENTETGAFEGLTYSIAVRKSDDAENKCDLEFTNHYRSSPSHRDDPKPKPEEEKTYLAVDKVWTGDKNHPASVTIELRDGDTVVDTVTLGDWNNWHYSWHDLDASTKRDWNVVEVNVPDGYTVSYAFNGTTFTVRNTEKLIQTGQLNWPVPVMAALGLALVCAGLVLLRKKKESGNAE